MPLQQLDFARRRLPRHRPVARLRASRVVHPGNQGQDLVRQAASQRPRRRRCARSPRAPPAPARRTTSCSIPAWNRSSAAATYRHNRLVQGGVNVGAGGVKASALVVASGLPTGHNGRVKVDQQPARAGPPGDLRLRRPGLGGGPAQRAHAAAAGPGRVEEAETVAATSTPNWTASRWRRSGSTTRGSSSRSAPPRRR
jgi:hypothetical protein